MNNIEIHKKIYTVSELNQKIRMLLEGDIGEIWCEGEISNYKLYPSGHAYFSLKDASAQLKAVMFRSAREKIQFEPKDGLKVVAHGLISYYTVRGDCQINVDALEPSGLGALMLAFQQLKEKLEKEGLFDSRRKKRIPALPQRIGIITSPTGAAIRDILSVLSRRFANVEVLLYPVRVQGTEAKTEIAQAIEEMNENFPELDVLLVGRGGGSLEDLWAFNEEIVARAIAASRVPIISCVGHEIDYTIADFVADLRAPTPSAAAELVVKNKAEISQRIESLTNRLKQKIFSLLETHGVRLEQIQKSRALTRPAQIFEERLQEMDEFRERIARAMGNLLALVGSSLSSQAEKLGILSPLAHLARGYSIAWKLPENEILKDSHRLKPRDSVKIRLDRGEVFCTVEKTT